MATFQGVSEEALRRFLHNVVVVDDQAYKKTDVENPQDISVSKTTLRMGAKKKEGPANKNASAHTLNAKAIIHGFAAQGITCSVLEPSAAEDLPELVLPAAMNADVVILDWELFNKAGEYSLEMLSKILEHDGNGRLRLVSIYTGEPDLHQVSEQIKKYFDAPTLLVRKNGMRLIYNNLVISIFAKESSKVQPEYAERIVPEGKLPDALINDFSQETAGLLSNAVLVGLTAVRNNTHTVLRKFSPELDPSYIAHRMLSHPVSDVKNHLAPLVADELEAVLEQSEMSSCVNRLEINLWAESPECCVLDSDVFGLKEIEHTNDVFSLLLAKGRDEAFFKPITGESKRVFNKIKKEDKLSHCSRFLGGDSNGDRAFAILTTCNSRYSDKPPVLTLGSIVHDGSDYWLCLQPPCDSQRVDVAGCRFPFLKLQKAMANKSIDVVVEDNEEYVDLHICNSPSALSGAVFQPRNEAGEVEAIWENNNWSFRSLAVDRPNWKWVASLKTAHAQRAVNNFAAQISRVGLSESSWLSLLKG